MSKGGTTQRMGRGGLKEGCNIWDLSNEQRKKHLLFRVYGGLYYPVMWRLYYEDPY